MKPGTIAFIELAPKIRFEHMPWIKEKLEQSAMAYIDAGLGILSRYGMEPWGWMGEPRPKYRMKRRRDGHLHRQRRKLINPVKGPIIAYPPVRLAPLFSAVASFI